MQRRYVLLIAGAITLLLAGAGTVVVTGGWGGVFGGAAGPAPASSVPGGSSARWTSSTGDSTSSVPSPFTGLTTRSGRPVLAVKIDNVAPARPQTGLAEADLVYIEPVEGGLSRLLAVFSSRMPDTVGPVRSARESDLELLRQFGHPGLAFSGANRRVLAAVAAAPVTDLSQARVPGAYHRGSAHPAPHNLYADPAGLLRAGSGVSSAPDIGFRFGPLAPGTGTATAREVVRYPASSTTFTWSSSSRRWLVSFDGVPARSSGGSRLGAATVVIQYTSVTDSALHDVLGNVTPYTHSTGSGTALVLRDGRAIQARWSRPSEASGTTFTTSTGSALPFATGQVWVIFAKS